MADSSVLLEKEIKDDYPPSVLEQPPTCCECLVFPTASIYAILACGSGFNQCPAIPHLSTFGLLAGVIIQLDDILKWFFRIPFNPRYLDNKSTVVRLTVILDALVIGLCVWGCSMSLPEIERLPHGGGHDCSLPVYLTGFLTSVMPPFFFLLRLTVGLVCMKPSLDAEKSLGPVLDQDYGEVSTNKVEVSDLKFVDALRLVLGSPVMREREGEGRTAGEGAGPGIPELPGS